MNTMKSGITYNQGDILLVPFPFSDLTGSKKRPVLVISKNKDNEQNNDLITCVITSNPKKVSYSITINSSNLQKGKLPMESKIRINKIFTLEKSIILKKFAMLDPDTLKSALLLFKQLV